MKQHIPFLKMVLFLCSISILSYILFQIIFSVIFNVRFYLFGHYVDLYFMESAPHIYSMSIGYEFIETSSFFCSFIILVFLMYNMHKKLINDEDKHEL